MTRTTFAIRLRALTNTNNRKILDLGIAVFGVPLGTLANVMKRWSTDRVGVAVVFHRIGDPQGDPAKEFVPARGTRLFEAQLRHLKRGYRLVKASELLTACQSRRIGQRIPVAITFDDDLASHASVALPMLQDAEVQATFFLCGASLERPFAFWWERLQVALDHGTLPDVAPNLASAASASPLDGVDIVYRLLSAVEAMTPDERDELSEQLERHVALAPSTASMGADDVKAIALAGHEIGFHTRRHEPLPTLPDRLLSTAMTHGKNELEEVAGETITAIAYPQGKADARTAQAAESAGYRYGYAGHGRPVRGDTHPLLMGRMEPSFKSTGHLSLRLAQMLMRSCRSNGDPQERCGQSENARSGILQRERSSGNQEVVGYEQGFAQRSKPSDSPVNSTSQEVE